jgi:hypothetical protein
MNYSTTLYATKHNYPFERWPTYFEDEKEGEKENPTVHEKCGKVQHIMDELIESLIEMGEMAPIKKKERRFEIAIKALNNLDQKAKIIENEVATDLIDLFNTISYSAGLNPDDYGDGEGITSEWRFW